MTALAADIARLGPWFHNLHLPGGVQTVPDHPLGDFPRRLWMQIAPHVPERLSGWTVLDIGCNAGFYTFELARRGAEVTAIDVDPHYLRQARWAAGHLGFQERVTFRQMQIYELAHQPDQFDLVWFMGVFYHLRYPLLALDLLHEHAARDLIVVQSMLRGNPGTRAIAPDYAFTVREHFEDPRYPRLHFVEHAYAGDPTNWWVPNRAALEAMLRSAGFEVAAHPEDEVFVCRRGPRPDHRAREGGGLPWSRP
jgi:tRNA (mo5U34)-methyltransferase